MLHNRIHDNLALVAVEELKTKHPGLVFTYTNAGAAGIDITGVDDSGSLKVVAEVKTTLPDAKGRMRGPQTSNIRKDLDRLMKQTKPVSRYLVVLSPTTKTAIQRQLQTDTQFPTITIFNALNESYSEASTENE